jgi:hypothetical protein
MTSTPHPPQIGLTGARFGRSARTGTQAAAEPAAAGEPATAAPGFDTVMRGYERGQVDHFVRRQEAEAEALRAALAAAEQKCDRAQRRAAQVGTENQALHAAAAAPPPVGAATGTADAGFGVRAERLLRLAETEAAEVRSQAVRDAADLMERSRLDAERHRHELERALIARVAEHDHLAACRDAELAEREEQVTRQLDAARTEADRVNTVALRDADRIRHDAETVADSVRTAVRAELDRLREDARHDVDLLAGLRDDALRDIRRLADVLTAEVAPPPRNALRALPARPHVAAAS